MIVFTSKKKFTYTRTIQICKWRCNLSKNLSDSWTNIASTIIFNIVSLLNNHDLFFSMLPLQIASEYVGIFIPFTQLMIIFIVIKLKYDRWAWTPNTASSKISGNRCCEINKTLNPVTIINPPQSLGWISIHSWTIIHDLYRTSIKLWWHHVLIN